MKTAKKLGRPRKITSWNAKILRERAREYFDKCDARTRDVPVKDGLVTVPWPAPYSIEGLCCYLDIPRWTFDSWRKQDDPMGERARMIHQRITADRVEGALDGRQNSAFARFMLTNNDPEHYREKVEVDNNVSGQVTAVFEGMVNSWKRATSKD